MIRLLGGVFVALFFLACGGGESEDMPFINAREKLENNTFYEALCIQEENNSTKYAYFSYKFEENRFLIEVYNKSDFKSSLGFDARELVEYSDDEFYYKKENITAVCTITALKNSPIFVECTPLKEESNSLISDYVFYKNKEEALKNMVCVQKRDLSLK
jgi:Mn-containing catalase